MKAEKIMMLVSMLFFSSVIFAEDITKKQKQALDQKAMHEMLQKIFYRAMEVKRGFQSNQLREDPIGNFATTAPRSEFIVNADISEELQSGTQSADVYVSTDGQATWQSAEASLIGSEGFETTWGGTINTSDGSSAYSYLSGVVDSEALGESFGTIIVSGTPHNVDGIWPPPGNLYAEMVNEPSGDASSNYDIVSLKGTYQGNDAIDSDGNEYTDIERIYVNLSLSGNCCDEGGLFGPWYLYGVGIVNPESEEAVAYAIGYGDGGFGQLTPGLLKLSGDLSSGELSGFDYLSTNINYSTSGNDMQATVLMDLITSDSQWGSWPNSYNGFIILGVTVEASLDGLDVAAEILDQTDPGLMVCTTTFQEGNTLLALSNPNFDSETNTLSVLYMDSDGNLPWFRSAQICNLGTSNCFHFMDMIPDSHTYDETVTYVASFTSADVPDGDYDVKFWFADDDIDSYPDAQITYPISVGSGSDCSLVGDINLDGILNVLDIVLLVNVVLGGEADCSDINNDGVVNVLDIVLLVNLVLG